jgi:nicotinamidase-related amidase
MPLDVTPHLEPARTAVVSMECQENLLGERPQLPGLAKSAHDMHLLDNLALLYATARSVGVRIYYCTDERRPDGFGLADNSLVHRYMADGQTEAGGQGRVMPQVFPQASDVVFRREQGVTGFFATGLDQYLRNTGVKTVIVTGVSLNLAVLGTAIETFNRGYTLVVPSDCTASNPPEYAESVLRYTMRAIGYVVPSRNIVEHWAALK